MKPQIKYEDFDKLDLRIGKIVKAEEIEKSNKLIKLMVDIGSEKRQVVAGIKTGYSVKQLLNKYAVILINLEPRTLFGIESQGMLLAANSDKPILLKSWKKVQPGTNIQ